VVEALENLGVSFLQTTELRSPVRTRVVKAPDPLILAPGEEHRPPCDGSPAEISRIRDFGLMPEVQPFLGVWPSRRQFTSHGKVTAPRETGMRHGYRIFEFDGLGEKTTRGVEKFLASRRFDAVPFYIGESDVAKGAVQSGSRATDPDIAASSYSEVGQDSINVKA